MDGYQKSVPLLLAHLSPEDIPCMTLLCWSSLFQWKRPVFAVIEQDSIFSHNLYGSFEIVSDLLSHPSWMSIQTEHPFFVFALYKSLFKCQLWQGLKGQPSLCSLWSLKASKGTQCFFLDSDIIIYLVCLGIHIPATEILYNGL